MQFISPFLVPLAGIFVAIVAIIAGAVQQMHNSRIKADQRMALLARGMSPQDIESFLKSTQEAERAPRDPMRSLANLRRAAIVLISSGLGLVVFFVLLTFILQVRPILAAAAAGLVPLAIGVGFLVDYNLQKRDLARFGMEVDQEISSRP